MEVTGRKDVQNGGRLILKMTTGFGPFSSLSKVKIYFFLLLTSNLSYFNSFKLPQKIRLLAFRSPLIPFTNLTVTRRLPRGITPIQYLYGYVPPNGIVVLELLSQSGLSILETCCKFECFQWQVVCCLVKTQGCRKQQQGYLFHTNAVIPHKTSHKYTLGL